MHCHSLIPRLSGIISAGAGKEAVECFEATSGMQTQNIQSLKDILRKFVPKRDIIKTADTRPILSYHAIDVKGPGYEASTVTTEFNYIVLYLSEHHISVLALCH